MGRKKLLENIEKSIKITREEEKRKSEEAKKLAEKRRIEAEKRAEELRIAREKEETERKAKEESEEEIDPETIGPSDFVEVEKVDDGDILEKPIDVSKIDPEEFFGDDDLNVKEDKATQEPSSSEFVTVEDNDEKVEYEQNKSEFVGEESLNEAEDEILSPNDDSFVEDIFEQPTDTNNDNVDIGDVKDENDDSFVEGIFEQSPDANDDADIGDVKDKNDDLDVEAGSDNDDVVKSEESDDSEVWESPDEENNSDDDAEVWESDEGVSPEDNAEVWENDKDYSDENDDSTSMSFAEKLKSRFKRDPDEPSAKESILSVIKFSRDSDKDEDFDDDVINDFKEDKSNNESGETSTKDDKVDLGFDDDYIYVDHSNDEASEDYQEDEFDVEDYAVHEEMPSDDEPDFDEDVVEKPIKDNETKKKSFKDKVSFKSKVDMEFDEPDVKDDDLEPSFNDADDKESIVFEDESDSGFKAQDNEERVVFEDESDSGFKAQDNEERVVFEDESDSGFKGHDNEESVVFEDVNEHSKEVDVDEKSESKFEDDMVDLGSDDDYIYVDHSNDEPSSIENEKSDSQDNSNENAQVSDINQIKTKSRKSDFVKSIISDVVHGESKLEPEEIETLHGEIMDDDVQLHKPAPKDDMVVEAEIVTGHSDESQFERQAFDDYFEEDEELNIFTDTLPDLNNDDYDGEIRKEATRVIDDAMSEFMDDVFNGTDETVHNVEDTVQLHKPSPKESYMDEEDIESHFVDEEIEDIAENLPEEDYVDERDIDDYYVDEAIEDAEDQIPDGEIPEEESAEYDDSAYFKGANDVTNPLRKNNVYYNDHKSRSLKDSIKGIKKDMQYINKSLNEIENPTQIDYVSVVDRTEEYDPNDYLSRPGDDDSDKIIQMEEESKFDQKEQGIESDFVIDEPAAEDVIVPVDQQYRREELKDQALESIIQSANDDYKEIEKERFQNNNKLKAFDDQKLPGKRKPEDGIIDYVQATDFGLASQEDLYSRPISKVAESINDIVDIEGPIHVKEVTNRVKDSCNIKRAGSKLKKTVNSAIVEAENSGSIIRIGDFLYDASNNNVVIRRRNKPNIELISDEEIAKSIELVLIHNSNVSTKQIAKDASRNFGFKSTSKKTASRINGVLDLMIANNRVKIVDDYVELN